VLFRSQHCNGAGRIGQAVILRAEQAADQGGDGGGQGTAVLLVEQNVSMALETADRAYVMEEGRIVAEGQAKEMMDRPEIRKAYLGLDTH
jgi:ABC-type Fe3+/spermidine/putrescine transport system ATPase subunit